VLALAAALLLGVLPGLTPAEARARLAELSPVAIVDRSQPDRPRYSLRFDSSNLRSLVPVGPGRVDGGRRVWRAFRFAGQAYDELTAARYGFTFTFRAVSVGGRISGFRGPPPSAFQPGLPLRAIFYYDWFPEGWTQEGGIFPFSKYHPSLGYYDSGDPKVVRKHVQAILYGHLPVGIYDWWGIGTNEDLRFPTALAVARTTPLHWAVVYEPEGYGDPSVERLRGDLVYLRDRYAARPAYLKLAGRFVVIAYGSRADTCATVDRWLAANQGIGAWLILKEFAGYAQCPRQPDGWYEFSGNQYEFQLGTDFFGISAGYEKTGVQVASTVPRVSLDAWRKAAADMVASAARNQFVISFNEWGESSAIESATEWASPSGFGAYLDVLREVLPPLPGG
jgi:hypothetical protein